MSWMQLLLAILAVYRLSRAIAQEDGPFDAFTRLRAAVGQGNWVGRGFHCVLCVSFWLAFAAAALLVSPIDWRVFLMASLGIAGGAVVVYQVVR